MQVDNIMHCIDNGILEANNETMMDRHLMREGKDLWTHRDINPE